MSDLYPQQDHARPGHRQGYADYAGPTSSGAWIWAGVVLVALVALIALGASGGGDTSTGEAAMPGAAIEPAGDAGLAPPAVPEAAPATPTE